MLLRRFLSDSTSRPAFSVAIVLTLLLTGIPVAQAAITSPDVEPASLVAGANGDVVVSFTTSLSLAPLDTVVITFPAGFDVSGATKPTDCTGATGGGILNEGIKTLSISGQDVILTYDGDILDIWEAGAKTCTIGNITNPTAAGSTGTYAIETQNALGATIEGPVTVSADTIVADVIASVAYTSAPTDTDADTTVTFVAQGQDQYSNPTGDAISYSVDSGSGSIDGASGVFSPNKTGTTVINASAAVFWATASIGVTVGDLASIVFTAAPTSTDADTNSTFVAEGRDANGNAVADVITYTIDTGSGSIDSSTGVFSPNKTGTTVVKAAAGLVSSTASIDTTPGAANSIVFVTAPSTTDRATAKTFDADVLDAKLNPTADAVSYAIDSGSGSINSTTGVFTPGAAGATVIRATAGALSKTTSIDVTEILDDSGDSGGDGGSDSDDRTSYGPRAGKAIQPSPQTQRDHWIEMRKGAIEAMRVLMDDAMSIIVTVTTLDVPATDLPEGYTATDVHFDIHVEPEGNVTGAEIHLQPIEARLIGHPAGELVILHNVDGQWVEVPTVVAEEDGRLRVSFETPSFSAFALAHKQVPAESAPAPEPAQESDPHDASSFPWGASAILAGLLGVIAVVVVIALRRGRDL